MIDTCAPPDTRKWETGISPKDEKWVIVQQYDNKEDAVRGHAFWVKAVTDDPEITLVDIDLWGLNEGEGE